MISQWVNATLQVQIARMIRILIAVGELAYKPLVHRPNSLSFTSTRSNKRVRGRSLPASIRNPMTMMNSWDPA